MQTWHVKAAAATESLTAGSGGSTGGATTGKKAVTAEPINKKTAVVAKLATKTKLAKKKK
jgi:hypothetical protein